MRSSRGECVNYDKKNMTNHNPKQEIEQLQTILSSPSIKIGFFFGAGISMEDKKDKSLIPGIEKMTKKVVGKFTKDSEKKAIGLIKKEIESNSRKFNIETLLSKISEKARAAGSETLCGLTAKELNKLREKVECEIRKIVAVHGTRDIINTNHNTFAKWVKNADRKFSVEIFTTNYDYFLELALENQQIPYFDGFVGSYNAFFCPEWIEDDSPVRAWVKLWKIHGSLGWNQNKKNEIIRTAGASGKSMIYPSFLKYDHARKQPYLSYMDRLSYFLRQEDSILFVCGHSFGDEHINDMILTSLARSRSSHVFVFKKGDLKEDDVLSKEIAKKNSQISVFAKKTAVIGGHFAEWQLPSIQDSSPFFKEDKPKEDKNWDGKGDLILGDFKEFTEFLSGFYKKYDNSKE